MSSLRREVCELALAAEVELIYHFAYRNPRTGEVVPWRIELEAPEGQRFVSSGCHVDMSVSGEGEVQPRPIPWATVRARVAAIIAEGFAPCEDPDCDICADA